MGHGNRQHEAPKYEPKEWVEKTNKKNSITQWILDCVQHEKDISNKNKLACEQFHNRHIGI